MVLEFIDTIRVFLETEVFGSTAIFAFFIIGFCLFLFFIARLNIEMSLLLCAPLLLGFAVAGLIPTWFIGIVCLIAAAIMTVYVLKTVS